MLRAHLTTNSPARFTSRPQTPCNCTAHLKLVHHATNSFDLAKSLYPDVPRCTQPPPTCSTSRHSDSRYASSTLFRSASSMVDDSTTNGIPGSHAPPSRCGELQTRVNNSGRLLEGFGVKRARRGFRWCRKGHKL